MLARHGSAEHRTVRQQIESLQRPDISKDACYTATHSIHAALSPVAAVGLEQSDDFTLVEVLAKLVSHLPKNFGLMLQLSFTTLRIDTHMLTLS